MREQRWQISGGAFSSGGVWPSPATAVSVNRLTNIVHKVISGGNRSWVKRANGKGDVFRYDALDQITNVLYEATTPDGSPSAWTNEAKYTYDAAGNFDTVNLTNTALWSYGGGDAYNRYYNLLVSWTTGAFSGFTYFYDRNGNLATDLSGWGFNYDRENRLLTATNATTSVTNTYDAFNWLVERQVGANKTRYIYDKSWRVLAEYDQNNALVAKYVYGPEIDELLRMNRAGTNYFYHADALGDITEVTSTNGTKLESYTYDVFGAPTIRDSSSVVIANSAISNRFMFQGRDRDPDTGLYNFRNRYYSPSLGRFLQPDPIGQEGGFNLYSFVGNNPQKYTDPTGEGAQDIINACFITPAMWQAQESYRKAWDKVFEKYGPNVPDNIDNYMRQWENELKQNFGPQIAPAIKSVPGTSLNPIPGQLKPRPK